MNKYLQLFRPVVLLMGVVFLIAAAFIAAGSELNIYFDDLLIAVPVVLAFVIGGNSINDYVDREVDRLAHPERPIPSGRMAADTALYIGMAALTFAVIISFLLPNYTSTAIVIAACLFIIIYELLLKQRGFIGNITIGVLTGMVFLLGGAVVGNAEACYAIAVMIILISLGREIGLDIKDMDGDVGRITLPMKMGKRNAAVLAALFFAAAVLVSIYPLLQGGVSYLYCIIILADILIALAAYSVFKHLDKFETLVIVSMFMSAIAFVFGAV